MSRMPEGLSREEVAERLRRRYSWLKDFNDDELRELSFCYDPGYELQEGELYLDLEAPERGIIRGRRGEKVQEGHCLVSKSQLKDRTWEKLTRPFRK